MAKFTSGFGVLLTVVSVMGYLTTHEVQSFWFGVALIVCGVLADSENRRRRMIAMHIAVVVGLVAFLLPALEVGRAIVREHRLHSPTVWTGPLHFHEVLAFLTLIYVTLCIGSFIQARLNPAAATPSGAEAVS